MPRPQYWQSIYPTPPKRLSVARLEAVQGKAFDWCMTSSGLSDQARLDGVIRLWQNIMEAMLLQGLSSHLADAVRPATDRAWFAALAPVSGIPTAAGIDHPPPLAPFITQMTFNPTPERLCELYLVHRALRRAGPPDAPDGVVGGRAALAVLAGIAAQLRLRGLWPAYVRAARRARAALGPGPDTPAVRDRSR